MGFVDDDGEAGAREVGRTLCDYWELLQRSDDDAGSLALEGLLQLTGVLIDLLDDTWLVIE